MLKEGGAEPGDRVSFVAADLERDAGWSEAVAGCEYVLHVASPFPATLPKDENELVVPAREGALRVLRASRDAGVKRVVLTSSFAAIGYGHRPQTTPFDETSWTDPNGDDVRPYVKSKTLAERAAWDFVAREGGGLELSVVNPVGVFGPVLAADYPEGQAPVGLGAPFERGFAGRHRRESAAARASEGQPETSGLTRSAIDASRPTASSPAEGS
jgi:dihydroflavonol-4-reductase